MDSIAKRLREFWLIRLKCRGCGKVTMLGLDDQLRMSKRNDDMRWWRERFRCSACGAKNPYMSVISTHLTEMPKGKGPDWRPESQFGI